MFKPIKQLWTDSALNGQLALTTIMDLVKVIEADQISLAVQRNIDPYSAHDEVLEEFNTRQHMFDFIFMDVNMPVMDGL